MIQVMKKIREYIASIRRINNNRVFETIYVFCIALITSLFWILGTMKIVPYYSSLVTLTLIAGVSLLLLNDFKYFIPCVISFIFANPDGYKSDAFPIPMLICGFSLIGVLLIFTACNFKKLSFKNKNKSFIALIYFAIFSFVPLIYHNLITSEVKTLVFVYFSYILYLGIYVFFLANMNEDSKHITFKSCEMIALICAFECIAKVILMHQEDPTRPLLSMWYFLGWGLCNEAGIMICFGLPFLFMKTKSFSKWYQYIFFIIELALVIVGMLVTTSRGTYLFGSILILILTILSFVYSKHKIKYSLSIIISIIILLIGIELMFGLKDFVLEIIEEVFEKKLDSNGRYTLFDTAVKLWNDGLPSILFGKGWVAERLKTMTYYGIQEGYMVYHSTFFETLACYGAIGVFVLIFHFYEKYKTLFKLEKFECFVLIAGFVLVDLYGMIDNTYHFYYYMIPLIILMSSLDAAKRDEKAIIL